MTSKVLFIDRDGTLIEEPHDNQVDALSKIRLVRGVIPALIELADNGYRFVMVSNQDGLGTESFPLEAFEACHEHVVALFESQGIRFDETFICPHFEHNRCDCRKPRTGLLTRFLARNNLDSSRSAVIGDRSTDLELAKNLGLRGFLVDPDASYETSWPGIVAALCSGVRSAEIERTTRETTIRARVNLDTAGRIDVSTGIGMSTSIIPSRTLRSCWVTRYEKRSATSAVLAGTVLSCPWTRVSPMSRWTCPAGRALFSMRRSPATRSARCRRKWSLTSSDPSPIRLAPRYTFR